MRHPTQTAIVQTPKDSDNPTHLPLSVSPTAPVPSPQSPHHVLIRILAVALNPNDHKMVTYFNKPGSIAGCDLSGVIQAPHPDHPDLPVGTRVCGALFPYNPTDKGDNGSFAQYCTVDARLLVKVPPHWSDTEAAALGVAWSTISLALSDPHAMGLEGLPSRPAHQAGEPVVVYGGATASGTFACQMLNLMGYTPLAITSPQSAPLALSYGAKGTASYTAKDCVATIQALAGKPIRYVLDCITDADSTALCYSLLARTGGVYACLEECPAAWRSRRAVRVKEVMGFQVLGTDLNLGESAYTRSGDPALLAIGMQWAKEVEGLMARREIKPHPLRELSGGWESIIEGLEMLRKGEVRGEKLVVRIPQ
ncbi:zinc-binding alcohol dehydrogenase family protein [Aspergillus fijiensis CBS 313.89]|uniref:GroES-like protein n=1 Tax=Aspergillus fijiensis CBS 313.89 TaxID=1448319 RepID=A0A8G1RSW3_9EURO|nr:GroES-like protein [Aspergillus fijiensis CBS 313.89]RAK78087.1 GroES-like protein [Aspergillus fijiensis CBS 313.89]